jgi:hypothetical protein
MAQLEFTQWEATTDFSDGVWSVPVLAKQSASFDRINWGSIEPITPESLNQAIDTLIAVIQETKGES